MYGTETKEKHLVIVAWFENDVKMYGTETLTKWIAKKVKFENDVKMYGTETRCLKEIFHQKV